MKLYIYSIFLFPFFLSLFLPASVGQSCFYASVIQMCYSVFFYPHVTLEFNFYINNVLFFLFYNSKLALRVFLSLILSVYVLAVYTRFFFDAHDFCLFYLISSFFFSLFSFLHLSLINDNQPTNNALN